MADIFRASLEKMGRLTCALLGGANRPISPVDGSSGGQHSGSNNHSVMCHSRTRSSIRQDPCNKMYRLQSYS